MHPMFKELFIDTDADDLVAEQDRRRRVRRSRRARPAQESWFTEARHCSTGLR